MNYLVKKIHNFFSTLLIVLLFAGGVSAQRDLIVTQAGEEIRCRILDETPNRFVYAYLGKKDKVLRNEIFKNLVTSFKYDYYDSDLIRSDKLPGDRSVSNKKVKRVDTKRTKSTETNASKDFEPRSEVKRKNDQKKKKGSDDPEVGATQPTEAFPAEKEVANEEIENVDVEEIENMSTKDIKAARRELKKKGRNSKRKVDNASKDLEAPSENEVVDGGKVADLPEQTQDHHVIENSEVTEQQALESDESTIVSEEASKAQKVKKRDKIENEELLVKPEKGNEFKNYLKWRVGAKAGLSNIINNTINSTNAYDLYQEELLKGWHFGADIGYFITEGFGIGAMFTNYKTGNSVEGITYPNLITGETVDNGDLSTSISTKYVGPVLYFRKSIDFKTFVVLGLSGGQYFYDETGSYNSNQFNFKSETYGGAATLGLDFLLGNDIMGRDIILSLEAGYNYARFNSINYGESVGTRDLSSPMVMDRLDFSIGLRFMRFPRYLTSK